MFLMMEVTVSSQRDLMFVILSQTKAPACNQDVSIFILDLMPSIQAMGIEKDTQINPMDTPRQMFQVLDLLGLRLGNQIKHVFSTQRQATVDLVSYVGFSM